MRFRAIDHVLPSRPVANDEILQRIHDDSKSHLSEKELHRLDRLMRFAFRSMGTETRYRCAEGERPHALATQAGVRALTAAAIDPEEIDLLMYVGVGRGFLEPATANVFQDSLGLSNATCFDILDACASWLRAVHVARAFLETGAYRNIMILNAEFNTHLEDYALHSVDEFDYRFPGSTIGEAATATILSPSERDDECAMEFRSFGDQRAKCIIPLSNWADYLGVEADELEPMKFTSYGSDIMQFGMAKLVEQYRATALFEGFEPDLVLFHAASDGVARDGMGQCGIAEERGFFTHSRFGNTVSATIPLAMSIAEEEGRLQEGTRVGIGLASAGISTGLARFRFWK